MNALTFPGLLVKRSSGRDLHAVSPGHEDEGVIQMLGGQSGHLLSPCYRAGHEAWVKGEPMPLLPGLARHTLRLEPKG
jgi:penicillin amidase